MLLRALDKLREHVQVAGDDKRRELVAQQVVDTLAAYVRLQGREVGMLRSAHHLDTLLVEVLVKSSELQTGSVYLMVGDKGIAAVLRHVYNFQLIFVDYFLKWERKFPVDLIKRHKNVPFPYFDSGAQCHDYIIQRFADYFKGFCEIYMGTSKNRFEEGKWVECAECDESRRSKAVCLTRRFEEAVGVLYTFSLKQGF